MSRTESLEKEVNKNTQEKKEHKFVLAKSTKKCLCKFFPSNV